jgi:hypothetical protein
MKDAPLSEQLQEMLRRHAGIRGCALVDAGSGLVWHTEPAADSGGLWEAAVDHWRLHRRLSGHFDALGEAGAIVTYHRGATMAMLPCLRDPEVLLVCVAAPSAVDWRSWQDDAHALGRRIRAAM